MRTGGRGISSVMRVAHDSSLCEGSLWGEPRLRTRKDFASAEATEGRSPSGGFAIALWKPSLALFSCNWSVPKLAGRGGSVSRRDHSPKTRKRAQRRMGAQVCSKSQAYSQPLFGRGGLGERRFSQRSGLSPRNSRKRRQVAAALSAAVTTAPKQENAPNSHGRASL